MAKKLFGKQLAKRIEEMLIPVSFPVIKTVKIGDLSHLPSPDTLGDFCPAIMIAPVEVDNTFADGADKPKIIASEYLLTLYYVKEFDPNIEHNLEDVIDEAEEIAQIFFNNPTLKRDDEERYTIESGGQVLSSLVKRVRYASAITDFYKSLNIPVEVIEIEFKVLFRTFNL